MAGNRKAVVILKRFLLLDAIVTVLLFAYLGIEGVALLACNFYEAEVCPELRKDERERGKQAAGLDHKRMELRRAQKAKGPREHIRNRSSKRKAECRRIGGSFDHCAK